MLSDFFSLVMMLIVIAVILYLSYLASKKLGSSMMQTSGSRNIQIIERAYLERDKSVAIVKVGEKAYLLGVSPENVTLLEELDEAQLTYDAPQELQELPAAQFATLIKSRLKKGK